MSNQVIYYEYLHFNTSSEQITTFKHIVRLRDKSSWMVFDKIKNKKEYKILKKKIHTTQKKSMSWFNKTLCRS